MSNDIVWLPIFLAFVSGFLILWFVENFKPTHAWFAFGFAVFFIGVAITTEAGFRTKKVTPARTPGITFECLDDPEPLEDCKTMRITITKE